MSFDPRITPARGDLAAAHLKSTIAATRYVDGQRRCVRWPSAPIKFEPRPDVAYATEALMGDIFTVYDQDEEGWAWGQLASDGYVGWIPADSLGVADHAPTHKVVACRSHFYPIAGFKAPPLASVSMGARLCVLRTEERWCATEHGFIRSSHLAPIAECPDDFVTIAEQLVGTPYLWGGKSAFGIDCSGLVQISRQMAGFATPRDSDMQESCPGISIDSTMLERGDLVFWKGHVGIMLDAHRLVHANVWHMAVAIEPLAEAIRRIRMQNDSAPTGYRRLS